MRFAISLMVCVLIGFVSPAAYAGELDPAAAPDATSSYGVNDIYNRLDTGADGVQSIFTEPTAGPEDNTYNKTLDEVMGIAPAKDNDNGARPEEVLAGKKFWCLIEGSWGLQEGEGIQITSGAMTVDNTKVEQDTGYYNAFDLSDVDTDLVTGNIKSGVTIFGVEGDSNVVDTSSGDAVAGDILTGKSAYVKGSKVTGNVAAGEDVNGDDGDQTFDIPNGLYSGQTLKTATANDSDLVSANIKSGVTIFDVDGDSNVVDTSDGTAVAEDILINKSAYVKGAKVTGNVAVGKNVSGGNGSKTFNIPNGLYSGQTPKTATANDSDLVSTNIKNGVTIFGVLGTATIAPVPKTGAADCYKTDGTGRTCTDTGEDGEHQTGAEVTGDRFTDNGDGTVTDNLTNLIWLKNANCAGTTRNWQTALDDVAELNSNGTMNSNECGDTSNQGSNQTDWRLPNIKELQSLVHFGYFNPALSNAAGTAKWTTDGNAFSNVQSDAYWSSTSYVEVQSYAWDMDLYDGDANSNRKTAVGYVWPVRGGL